MRVRVIAVVLRACVCVSHSLALKRQHCFDVRDRHEAGKSAIGLNVADF